LTDTASSSACGLAFTSSATRSGSRLGAVKRPVTALAVQVPLPDEAKRSRLASKEN
jgi:hypothetical protein